MFIAQTDTLVACKKKEGESFQLWETLKLRNSLFLFTKLAAVPNWLLYQSRSNTPDSNFLWMKLFSLLFRRKSALSLKEFYGTFLAQWFSTAAFTAGTMWIQTSLGPSFCRFACSSHAFLVVLREL